MDNELQDLTALMDELGSNLDQYGERKADLRKSLKVALGAEQAMARRIECIPQPNRHSTSRAKRPSIVARTSQIRSAQMLKEQTAYFDLHKDEAARIGQNPSRSDAPACSCQQPALNQTPRTGVLVRRSLPPLPCVRCATLHLGEYRFRRGFSGGVPRVAAACAHAADPRPVPAFHFAEHDDPAARGQIHVSLSDLLEGAPETVIRAIAHILLAKLYRKPIDAAHNARYKTVCVEHGGDKADRTDSERARDEALLRAAGPLLQPRRGLRHAQYPVLRRAHGPAGADLERDTGQTLAGPLRRRPQHHRGEPGVRPAVEPALRHRVPALPRDAAPQAPGQDERLRRCVHSREFKAEERQFPQLKEALAFIKRL